MAEVRSREELINYTLRALGDPVAKVNVTWEQCEDRLDDALQFFAERNYDGVERFYFPYQVTQEDISNQYVNTDAIPAFYQDGPTGRDIISITRVLQFGPLANINMFDIRYQMALNDYFGINRGLAGYGSLGLASYDITKRYIQLIQDMFQPEKTVHFNKVMNRLYLDMKWNEEMRTGDYLMIEAHAILDPNKYTEIYNDRNLKKYLIALIKRQWGNNLAKFSNVPLPGGAMIRGDVLVQEATLEIERLEELVKSEYELPPLPSIG